MVASACDHGAGEVVLWIPAALGRQLRLLDKFRVREKPYLSKQL